MEKVTVRLDRKTLEQIKRLAGPRGISRFIKEAAEVRVRSDVLGEYLRELDEEFGRVPTHVQRRVDRKFKRILGIKGGPRARARRR